jgi:hypothetical protein
MGDWTEKYRPKSLDENLGNGLVLGIVESLKREQ